MESRCFSRRLINMLDLIVSSSIIEITFLSLLVSLTAVGLSTIIGVPLGIRMARSTRYDGFWATSLLNTLMSLPPVFVGLVIYLILFKQGPLGWVSVDLLFTPLAMVVAQFILTLPIVSGITKSTVNDISDEIPLLLKSLGATERQIQMNIWSEARQGVLIGIISAFGRAFSEVGAVLIVGGNLKGYTRVLTTAIVTETSKGSYEVAIFYGVILLIISYTIISALTSLQLKKKG